MKLIKIISKSRDGNQMEVVAKEDKAQKTLHIRRVNDVWRYLAGKDEKGNKVFEVITV